MRNIIFCLMSLLAIASCAKHDVTEISKMPWTAYTFIDSVDESHVQGQLTRHTQTAILRVENIGVQITDSPNYVLFRGDTFRRVNGYVVANPDGITFFNDSGPSWNYASFIHLPTDSTVIVERDYSVSRNWVSRYMLYGKR